MRCLYLRYNTSNLGPKRGPPAGVTHFSRCMLFLIHFRPRNIACTICSLYANSLSRGSIALDLLQVQCLLRSTNFVRCECTVWTACIQASSSVETCNKCSLLREAFPGCLLGCRGGLFDERRSVLTRMTRSHEFPAVVCHLTEFVLHKEKSEQRSAPLLWRVL